MAGRDAALRDSPTVREFFVGGPAMSEALSQTLRTTGVNSGSLPSLGLVRARRRGAWVATTPRDRLINVLADTIWDSREDEAANRLGCEIDVHLALSESHPLSRRQVSSLATGVTSAERLGLDVAGTALSGVENVRGLRELRAAIDYVRACMSPGYRAEWDGVSVGETTRRLVRLISALLPHDQTPQSPGLALIGPPNCVVAVTVAQSVKLSPTVVTVSEFRDFLSALPTLAALDGLSPGLPDEGHLHPMYARVPQDLYRDTSQSNQPAVGVSWWAADSYARWSGTRLPTSAEWEIAGRCWDGRVFPWGDTPDLSALNCADSSAGKPIIDYRDWRTAMRNGDVPARNARSVEHAHNRNVTPAGQQDMSGNVWEWVSTDLGVHRVIAGGSYDNPVRACVLSSRSVATPDTRSNAVGFRVVVS